MSSKPKAKTYIVHRNGNLGQPTVIGRYRVGARSPEEACELLKKEVGKHIKTRVYYEEKEPSKLLPHGVVIREC
jgi:hypothetical protein